MTTLADRHVTVTVLNDAALTHITISASDASYSCSFQSYTSADQSRLDWQLNGSEMCVGPSHKAFKACHTTGPVNLPPGI